MSVSQLRLGILGLSPGNGHPYSWAAIFNGYEPSMMASCPFPIIPNYLSRQSFPKDSITGAAVTHIWTQDRSVSAHVAAASGIRHIVDDFRTMIGQVDAILLARDDAENHLTMAAPFLDAGLPIYIDKPLALSLHEAERIYACERHPGQIFSCSAMKYARELQLTLEQRAALEELRYVDACISGAWDTYAVHIIEPLLAITGSAIAQTSNGGSGDLRWVDVLWENGLRGRVITLGKVKGDVVLRLFGDRGYCKLRFTDAFAAFKAALQSFIDIVRGDAPPQERHEVMAVISLIEAGRH